MLSAIELAAMRAAQEATMSEDCVIRHYPLTQDGQGRWLKGAPVETATVCRIGDWGGADERLFGGQLRGRVGYVLTFPHDTLIYSEDVVVIGSRQFEVVAARTSSYPTAIRAICVEVI